jgi:ComF family protein
MDISNTLSTWIRPIVPPACVLCDKPAGDSGLCIACLTALPRAEGVRCPVCASPTATATYCGRCIQRRPQYDYAVAALEYASPVDHLIAVLKYSRDLSAARALAFMLARVLEHEPYPDVVLAMPIAPTRLRERGFNQAEEIARYACAEFGIRVSHGIARRTSARSPQASLPWRERAKNVRGVFTSDNAVAGKTVAVIDDVITTGATLNELAAVLKRAGAKSVTGWVVARTSPNR